MSTVISDTQKIDVEIQIEVECAECRAWLEAEYDMGTLKVIPCEDCLEKSKKAGHDEGFDEGRDAEQRHAGDVG